MLKEYINCEYEEGSELCEAIYEYQVNGVTYEVSPSLISSKEGFTENKKVHYNPDNPSESIIYVDWSFFIVIGLITVVVALALLQFQKRIMQIILEKMDNIKTDNMIN